MKRSEINAIVESADQFIRGHGFHLPPFAYWHVDEWASRGDEVREIVECELGWDITDFGSGEFDKVGLTLFTLRNGRIEDLKTQQGKLYAEKIMVVGDGQITPFHFHWTKTEDIINRGGGKLLIQLYNSTPDYELADTPVTVQMDGVAQTVQAGGVIELEPGQSVTLPTRLYHKFWAEEGRTLVGEVSLVNDDHADNHFFKPIGRFPAIDEDVSPHYLLTSDYQQYWQRADA